MCSGIQQKIDQEIVVGMVWWWYPPQISPARPNKFITTSDVESVTDDPNLANGNGEISALPHAWSRKSCWGNIFNYFSVMHERPMRLTEFQSVDGLEPFRIALTLKMTQLCWETFHPIAFALPPSQKVTEQQRPFLSL